jgi:histidyl-tRNA synthetase
MKGQMKQADRSGARWAAIVGEQELATGRVTLKDLRTGEQREVALGDLEKEVGAS